MKSRVLDKMAFKGSEYRLRKQDQMAVTRVTNTRFVLVSGVMLLLAVAGMVKLGPGPMILLSLLPWMVVLFQNRPLSLVLLWLLLMCVDELAPNIFFRMAGFFLLPMDPAYFFTVIFLGINAIVRWKDMARALKANPFLSLFLAIVLAYILLYLPLYGKSAIGEARKFYFCFFFPLLTALAIQQPADLRRLMLAIFFVATCISIVAILRFLSGVWIENMMNAEAVLVLLLAALSIPVFYMNGTRVINPVIDISMLMLFVSVVVMTQHRSVWLAGGMGIFMLFGFHRDRILFLSKMVVVTLVMLGVIGIAFFSVPRFQHSVTKAVGGIIAPTADANASWRIQGWRKQLEQLFASDPWFGEGLGGYYSWKVKGGGVVKVQPHNAYVQILLKFGIFGLFVYIFLIITFFRKTLKVRKGLAQGPVKAYMEVGIVGFGAAHAYMMGYGTALIIAIFYAIAMSMTRLLEDSRTVPAIV